MDAGFLDAVAELRDVLAIVEVVDRITVREPDDTLVVHGPGIDEIHFREIADDALRDVLVAHLPNAVAGVRGDLSHRRRLSFRYGAIAEVLRKRNAMKRDLGIGHINRRVRVVAIFRKSEEDV